MLQVFLHERTDGRRGFSPSSTLFSESFGSSHEIPVLTLSLYIMV